MARCVWAYTGALAGAGSGLVDPLEVVVICRATNRSSLRHSSLDADLNAQSLSPLAAPVCWKTSHLSRLVRQNLEMPNPFFDKDEAAPGMTPAAIGYRYRKFQLG